MKFLNPLFNIFKFHKLKIAALVGFYVFFLYVFFPFNDLGDLVATKISQGTQGQVTVDFDNLSLSLFPQPGLALSNVTVETPFTPTLSAKYLEVAPSIAGLLSFKPGVTVRAEDILGGDITLSTRGGDKTPGGKMKQKIALDFSKLNIGALSKLAEMPLKLEGGLSGSIESQVDPEFGEQPTGQISARLDKVVIPEGMVGTPMGPLPLPHLNLSEVILDGKMDKGTLEISKLVVGRPGGDLYINVNGKADVKIQRGPLGAMPQTGGYDLSVHLQVGEMFKQKFGPFLGFLQAYQTAGNSYAFRMSGLNAESPPNLTKIQ